VSTKAAAIIKGDNGNMAKDASVDTVTASDGGTLTKVTGSNFLEPGVMKVGSGGKFTHSTSGKASIFSTEYLGNPAATTPATYYAKTTEWDTCT